MTEVGIFIHIEPECGYIHGIQETEGLILPEDLGERFFEVWKEGISWPHSSYINPFIYSPDTNIQSKCQISDILI